MKSAPVAIDATAIASGAARTLVGRAVEAAHEQGLCVSIAVVDPGGNLVHFERMDDAQIGAAPTAIDKAFTAVAFRKPTSFWEASSGPGQADWGIGATLGGRCVVIPGGLPIYRAGSLIGGIGVCGASSSEDEACAQAAVDACELRSAP